MPRGKPIAQSGELDLTCRKCGKRRSPGPQSHATLCSDCAEEQEQSILEMQREARQSRRRRWHKAVIRGQKAKQKMAKLRKRKKKRRQKNKADTKSKQEKKKERREWKQYLYSLSYSEYLETDYWQYMRQRLLSDRAYHCDECGQKRSGKYLHVHHEEYTSRGDEDMDDLLLLCRQCHLHKYHADRRVTEEAKKIDAEYDHRMKSFDA